MARSGGVWHGVVALEDFFEQVGFNLTPEQRRQMQERYKYAVRTGRIVEVTTPNVYLYDRCTLVEAQTGLQCQRPGGHLSMHHAWDLRSETLVRFDAVGFVYRAESPIKGHVL